MAAFFHGPGIFIPQLTVSACLPVSSFVSSFVSSVLSFFVLFSPYLHPYLRFFPYLLEVLEMSSFFQTE